MTMFLLGLIIGLPIGMATSLHYFVIKRSEWEKIR